MGDMSASRSGRFTVLKYVLGSQFFGGCFCPWKIMKTL